MAVAPPPEDRKPLSQSQIIYVHGKPGVGKTHLLNALFSDLRQSGVRREDVEMMSVKLRDFGEVGISKSTKWITKDISSNSPHISGNFEKSYDFSGPKVVLLDDLGAENGRLSEIDELMRIWETVGSHPFDKPANFTGNDLGIYQEMVDGDYDHSINKLSSNFQNFVMMAEQQKSLFVITSNCPINTWRRLLEYGDHSGRTLSRFNSMLGKNDGHEIIGLDGRNPGNDAKTGLPFDF